MLVLTRKIHEEVAIGDNVTVKVLEVRRGRVKLGIDAPKDVRVQRKEMVVDASKVTKDVGEVTEPDGTPPAIY